MRRTRFASSRASRAALVLISFVVATYAPEYQAAAQAMQYALESATGLRLHNVQAEPTTLAGRKGIRVTISPEGLRQFDRPLPPGQPAVEQLAVIEGTDFQSGVIEAEIAGAPAPGAAEGARGFV